MQHRSIPLLAEMMRYKYLLWLLFGLVWITRIFGNDYPPSKAWAFYLITFLIGAIAGIVWTQALILAVGRRHNVATWEVLRFPVWIGISVTWCYRRIRGQGEARRRG